MTVDLRDLQGNVLRAYGTAFAHAAYLFVRVADPAAGRAWLAELCGQVTSDEPWPHGHKPAHTLNVALTADGLRAIGAPKQVVDAFPADFSQGMAARAEIVGDAGESHPQNWERPLRQPQVLLIAMAHEAGSLGKRVGELGARIHAAGGGLALDHVQRAAALEGKREHFGFADGFSQPAIQGEAGPLTRNGMGTPEPDGQWSEVAPGEFVHGYPGEDGAPSGGPPPPLHRSGSFMVWRKLRQDVAGFDDYARRAAAQLGIPEGTVKAKMVGRWQDGRSLAVSDRPEPADRRELDPHRINDFRYGTEVGFCPLGAHVRRANPRDALGFDGLLTKRHRIIRRGMPYTDDGEVGLIFACYQADIARQFEFIQARWMNDGDPFWIGAEKDPLTMAGERMTIQGSPPTFLAPLASFVTTKGGGYFFVPGLSGLRALAAAYWR